MVNPAICTQLNQWKRALGYANQNKACMHMPSVKVNMPLSLARMVVIQGKDVHRAVSVRDQHFPFMATTSSNGHLCISDDESTRVRIHVAVIERLLHHIRHGKM